MITVTQQPTNILNSGNNDSFYTVSGTTVSISGVTEYKYCADVYVNSVLSATLKSFPDPRTSFGVFNLRNVASNFVSYDFPAASTSIFQPAPNSSTSIQLFFREEYVSGSTFVSPSATTSASSRVYFNSSFDYTTNITLNLSGYTMASGHTGNFLQTGTPPFRAYSGLKQWLSYYNQSSTVKGMQVVTYDLLLDTLNTYFVANPYQFDPDEIQIVATGMPQLSGTVDFTNAAYYDVSLVSGTTTHIISQVVRYQVYENCGRFASGSYKLYWLCSFGEWNSWYFTKKNETTYNRTATTFKRIQGKIQGGSFIQDTFDPSTIPFYTAVEDSIVLSTDFLSDQDVIFLKGLFTSPAVYMEDATGIITSVVIAQDSYVLNKRVNNRPYALQLTVNGSTTQFSQQL